MKKSISAIRVFDAQQLIDAITEFSIHASPDLIYTNGLNGGVNGWRLDIIEETLTDGSKVYNLEVS